MEGSISNNDFPQQKEDNKTEEDDWDIASGYVTKQQN